MGEWNKGLCECFSICPECLIACCVPCILEGMNADKIGESAILYAVGHFFCYFVAGAILRGKIRERYNIEVIK